MKKNIQETNDINLSNLILKTILKTVWVVLFSVGFIFMSMNIVAPKLVLDIYDYVGLEKPAYIVQKRLYLRDGTNENLYNLIQRSIEMENYTDQAEYIVVMLDSDDYVKFQESIDTATRESLGARYSIYADSYDAYLRRHLVRALYKIEDKTEAKKLAVESIENGMVEINEYIALVANDKLMTESQKQNEIGPLCSEYEINLALENELLELDEALVLSSSVYDKIVIINQKIKLAETQYRIAIYTGDDSLKNGVEEKLKDWKSEVEELKGSLV